MAKVKVDPIVKYLAKKDFVFGDEIRFIDFIAVELFDFVQWLTDNVFYTENKNVARYVKRVKGLR